MSRRRQWMYAAPLKALVFDSIFDAFRGVVIYVRILEGEVKTGTKLQFMQTGREVVAEEVGYPANEVREDGSSCSAGEVGYIDFGFKELQDVRPGDTLTSRERPARSAPSRL